jgi:ABC-type polysaccharide/polyol phosphate export permease
MGLIRDTVRYRELIWVLAVKELQVRYKRSVLGFVWALLHPLLMMVILTLVFSSVMRIAGVRDYAVFLICTLFPWTFFGQAVAYGVESIVGNAALLKKVAIPKFVFPMAAVLANLINFLLSLIPLALLLLFLRFPFHKTWAYLPVPMLALVLFTLGCCFFFATANVYFRDMAHIVQIILSAWFYFSPIIYSLDFVPAQFHLIFRLNPMLYILNGFRLAIYGDGITGLLPSGASVALSLGSGMLALLVGYWIFRSQQDKFIFYL